MEFSGII